MQQKDFLIVALAPLPVLLIPLVGVVISKEWNWTWHDFVFAWVVLAGATFVYRLMATSKSATLIYRIAAALAVVAGFLIFWFTAAVQIIGDENPGNILYAGVILTGLTGVGLARFKPAGMARAAFATAFATILVPVIAFLFWPADFSPGVTQVFGLNAFFALLFVGSALLFRHAARRAHGAGEQAAA